MPYEAKDPQNIFTIFPKCLQGFKNFFTIFLKTLVKCCRGENCKRRQNYAGSSIPHICRACNAQNANTRIYAIYHETKAKIIKAIVVSRSEARGSSSNGILVGDQMSKCQWVFTFWMIQKCKTMQIYPWSQKWIEVVFSFQRQEYYWHGKSLKACLKFQLKTSSL